MSDIYNLIIEQDDPREFIEDIVNGYIDDIDADDINYLCDLYTEIAIEYDLDPETRSRTIASHMIKHMKVFA